MNTETLRLLVAKGLSAQEILEIAETIDAPKKRSAGAERIARWRAKKSAESVTNGVTCNGYSNALPPPIENNHTPPVSPNGENRAKRSKPIPAAKPEDVSEQVWSDWQDHRKRKGGTCTKTALDGIRREAEKAGWSLEAALSKAMQRNWQGFEAGWVANGIDPKATAPPGDLATQILARHSNMETAK